MERRGDLPEQNTFVVCALCLLIASRAWPRKSLPQIRDTRAQCNSRERELMSSRMKYNSFRKV